MANKEVSLNIDEMKTFIHHIVTNNRFLQSQGKPSVAVEVVGESGIGKTSAALQKAAEFGFNCVKLNLAQIEEIGDLVGFPIRQFQMCKTTMPVQNTQVSAVAPETKGRYVKKIVDGKLKDVFIPDEQPMGVTKDTAKAVVFPEQDCVWVDEHAIDQYSRQGYVFTREKRMSYCPPEWIADKKGGGFLILDDWNRADVRFIQAVMELVDRQEYISWKLPKDWHILLTANPDDGEYLVNTIDAAQRTRFIRANLKYDVKVWARWAEESGIDGRCINFLLMHPELVKKEVNPRSITTFFNAISSIRDFDAQLPLIEMIGEGSVGTEFSQMFVLFINNKLDRLPTPESILSEPEDEKALRKLHGVIGKGDSYRADIASVLGTRIINYSLVFAEDNHVDDAMISRLILLVTDEETFTNDLKYFMTKQIVNGNKQKFQKMVMNQTVVKMMVK